MRGGHKRAGRPRLGSGDRPKRISAPIARRYGPLSLPASVPTLPTPGDAVPTHTHTPTHPPAPCPRPTLPISGRRPRRRQRAGAVPRRRSARRRGLGFAPPLGGQRRGVGGRAGRPTVRRRGCLWGAEPSPARPSLLSATVRCPPRRGPPVHSATGPGSGAGMAAGSASVCGQKRSPWGCVGVWWGYGRGCVWARIVSGHSVSRLLLRGALSQGLAWVAWG